MSEAILTFQAQLSGVMETLLKTAVFEITCLVQASFQGEVVRNRQEVDILRQKLQWSEKRFRERLTQLRCEECGRAEDVHGKPDDRNEEPKIGPEEGCTIKEEEIFVGDTDSSCPWDRGEPPAPSGSCLQSPNKAVKESNSTAVSLGRTLVQEEEVPEEAEAAHPTNENEMKVSPRHTPAPDCVRPEDVILQKVIVDGDAERDVEGVAARLETDGLHAKSNETLTHLGGFRGLKECIYCGKLFAYSSRLKVHLLKHTGEKPFRCSQCGRRFTVSRNLERHLQIHAGDARFCCTQCGKSFRRADHLKVHQRVHTGERPYRCTQCGKSFRFSGDLNTHRRVHTGERPYSCTFCGEKFSQLRQLKSHQRLHNGLGRAGQLA